MPEGRADNRIRTKNWPIRSSLVFTWASVSRIVFAMGEINRIEGRRAFGLDPIGYDRSRPEIYQLLEGRCGLRRGARVLEIGSGTGLATKRLLELGADPLLVVEPDERLVNYLKIALGEASKRVEVKVASFEDVILPHRAFDLGVAATAFHWLDQKPSRLPSNGLNRRYIKWELVCGYTVRASVCPDRQQVVEVRVD
jgi:SAM-dependent methyltransferase